MTTSGAGAAEWQPRWHQLVKAMVRVHTPQRRGATARLAGQARRSAGAGLCQFARHELGGHVPRVLRRIHVRGPGAARWHRHANPAFACSTSRPASISTEPISYPRSCADTSAGPLHCSAPRSPTWARRKRRWSRELAPGSTCITANGFLETASYVRLAAAHRPSLIVLGMGMPRQEEVARVAQGGAGVSLPHRLRRRDHRFSGRQDSQGAALDAPHRA